MKKTTKFYKLSQKEKIEYLSNYYNVDILKNDYLIENSILENISENVVGRYVMPFSVIPHFKIDKNKEVFLPLVTEEASVVAALSNANRMLENAKIKLKCDNSYVIGQIFFLGDIKRIDKEEILRLSNNSYPSLIKRGGKVVDANFQNFDDYSCVNIIVDVVDAMGANIVNTILENIREDVEKMLQKESIMCILSNSAIYSKASAQIYVPYNDVITKKIAKKIEHASNIAKKNKLRQITHNKGILNGIEALIRATGNDTRAMSVSLLEKRKNMSYFIAKDNYLYGKINISILAGTVGGSIEINKTNKLALELLNNPRKKDFLKIAALVGLKQNFAALYALVTNGIQKGHMKLQNRARAIKLGATTVEIEKILNKITNQKISDNDMMEIIKRIRRKK